MSKTNANRLIDARGERKLGQMLKAAKAAGQFSKANVTSFGRHVDYDDIPAVTLSDAGIGRDLSSRAQKLPDISEEDFKYAFGSRTDLLPNYTKSAGC